MPEDPKRQVINWLNDAYAMEKAYEEVLERHAADAEHEPDVRDRLTRHVDETRRHAETVQECIETLGASVSRPKATFATFGAGPGMMNQPLRRTVLTNTIADYAAEHFAIATYQALIEAAEHIGEQEVADKLGMILLEELDMARFLEQQLIPAVHQQFPAQVG